KGSSLNGELRERTTCSDEMFATPLTAWPATRVKSGPPPDHAGDPVCADDGADSVAVAGLGAGSVRVAGRGAERGGAAARGAATDGVAGAGAAARTQPVATRPPTNPATTSTRERRTRPNI